MDTDADRYVGHVAASVSFDVDRWREIDDLVRWLKKEHRGKIQKIAEGPDARTIVIGFPVGALVIYQWDTGDVEICAANGAEHLVPAIIARYK